MKEKHLLLKNGTVYGADQNGKIQKLDKEAVDIRVVNGTITDIGKGLKTADNDEIIDLTGLTVLPGFVDLNCHLRDFDLADAEDVSSGTKAAAAGGYTTVLDYANTVPPRDNINALRDTLERIKKYACIQVLPAATVTKGQAGEELTDMVELYENGAVAFSDDGLPIMNMAVYRRALSYMGLTNAFLISHAEDKDLSGAGAMNESPTSTRLGLPCTPTASEAAAVAREIEVLRFQGGRIHFTHVSSAPAIALIRRAKEDGLPVTADVTPHYLTLTDEDIITYDASFKMSPPLRSHKDQKALIAAIVDGTVDAIATDHAPWPALYKTRPFAECANGILGFETAFALVYEALVLSKVISFERMVELFTSRPAKIVGIDKEIASGNPANLAIVDLNEKWIYDVNKSPSKSRNSPFHGRKLISKNVLTLYKGKIVFQDKVAVSSKTVR